MRWQSRLWVLLVVLLAAILVACGSAGPPQGTVEEEEPQPIEVTREVEVTEIVEGETEVITETITEEIVVTTTPEPAPATQEAEEEPTEEQEPTEEPAEEEATLPTATREPAPLATPTVPTPEPLVEERIVEVEWPARMALGDSDLIRLSLVPDEEGYVVTTEFPDHQTTSEPIAVEPRQGYALAALARLEGVGLAFSPEGEQAHAVAPGEAITWRWTVQPEQAGRHRLFLTLSLRWTPQEETRGPTRQAEIWSRPLEIEVRSFMGMTTRQAGATGIFGLVAGSVLSLPMMTFLLRPRRRREVRRVEPNQGLVIEKEPAFAVTDEERSLLHALFRRYARLVLKAEFRSGYSGARIFLALPIHGDGRADAFTIVKLGARETIEREFENYETFVKHTLPPITARIEDEPVAVASLSGPRLRRALPAELAALRYTFIGEPGRLPLSLRQALLANPDPALLERLFRTFGPNWWLQRHPYTFRLAEEYDHNLPSHYVLEPAPGRQPQGSLDGRQPPERTAWQVGDVVMPRNLRLSERRQDRGYLSLVGVPVPGNPPLRVRWHSLDMPGGGAARVVATRHTLLRELVQGLERFGLPDPLDHLPELLREQLFGTRSTIHGDLNLENVLIGPGDLVWLIDFAQTREGHTLADFAHLEAELIAHVLAPQLPSPEAYLALRRAGTHPFLVTVRHLAARCLFNPEEPREYDLALYLTCLGALKYANLDAHARHLLYLTAAEAAERL